MIKASKILTYIGCFLLTAAVLLTGWNLFSAARADSFSQRALEQLENKIDSDPSADSVPDYILNPYMDMPTVSYNGTDYIGVLQIQALGISLPVAADTAMRQLRSTPCRYSGSAYLNSLIICAHNYNSHFGRLKALHSGDTVTFTDTVGNSFTYRVAEIEILNSTAVSEIREGDWDLTLFTCTVGGRSRITVRCVRE